MGNDIGERDMLEIIRRTFPRSCERTEGFAMIVVVGIFVLALGYALGARAAGLTDQRIVRLTRGAGSQLMLESPFETVLIENPDIVEVHHQSDRLVLLEGLALGASNVVFIDANNVAIANIRVLVCKTAAVRTAFRAEAGCD
jgi:Flp pilus assembly secretin CpaC